MFEEGPREGVGALLGRRWNGELRLKEETTKGAKEWGRDVGGGQDDSTGKGVFV